MPNDGHGIWVVEVLRSHGWVPYEVASPQCEEYVDKGHRLRDIAADIRTDASNEHPQDSFRVRFYSQEADDGE